MKKESRIYEIKSLLLKSLQNVLSDEEEKRVLDWRTARKKNEWLFQEIQRVWNEKERGTALVEEKNDLEGRLLNIEYQRYQMAVASRGWEQIKQRVQVRRKRRLLKHGLAYAAVVALLVGICTIVWWYVPEQSLPMIQPQPLVHNTTRAILTLPQGSQIVLDTLQQSDTALLRQYGITHQDTMLSYESVKAVTEWHTLEVPRGGEYLLTLADGSYVWINAESKLKFPTRFEENERRVYLEQGEAYFLVAANDEQPFFVEVENMKVKVVGTEFNVMAYSEKPTIATTLVKGSIQLITPQTTLQITPSEQALFVRETGQVSKKRVNVDYYTSWKDGIFEFKGMPLEEVAMVLSRWYNVDFIFEDSQLKREYFTGAIRRSKSLEFILNIIRETQMIEYQIVDRTVIFTKKRKKQGKM